MQECLFFLWGFSFTDTNSSQDSRGRNGTIFHSTLPLPEHSDIYLQLCTWDGYHIFLIATLVFTRLLLDEIYRLTELLYDWLMIWYWFSFVCLLFDSRFCYSYLTWETGWLELASTIILVLQANRLTKCASQFALNWQDPTHVLSVVSLWVLFSIFWKIENRRTGSFYR